MHHTLPPASYLVEHRDSALAAVRCLGLNRGESWETVAWVRSHTDAEALREMLESSVLVEMRRAPPPLFVRIGLAHGQDGKHGVRVAARTPSCR